MPLSTSAKVLPPVVVGVPSAGLDSVASASISRCASSVSSSSSADDWSRELMAPQFVKPYVKTNKNDVADAEAICEAVGRPNMPTCMSIQHPQRFDNQTGSRPR